MRRGRRSRGGRGRGSGGDGDAGDNGNGQRRQGALAQGRRRDGPAAGRRADEPRTPAEATTDADDAIESLDDGGRRGRSTTGDESAEETPPSPSRRARAEPEPPEPEPEPEPEPAPEPEKPTVVTRTRRRSASRPAGPPPVPAMGEAPSIGTDRDGAVGAPAADGRRRAGHGRRRDPERLPTPALAPHVEHVPIKKKGSRKR